MSKSIIKKFTSNQYFVSFAYITSDYFQVTFGTFACTYVHMCLFNDWWIWWAWNGHRFCYVTAQRSLHFKFVSYQVDFNYFFFIFLSKDQGMILPVGSGRWRGCSWGVRGWLRWRGIQRAEGWWPAHSPQLGCTYQARVLAILLVGSCVLLRGAMQEGQSLGLPLGSCSSLLIHKNHVNNPRIH